MLEALEDFLAASSQYLGDDDDAQLQSFCLPL
mgnify:FL=1